MRAAALVCLCLCLAPPVVAQDAAIHEARVARFQQAFVTWLADFGGVDGQGVLALRHRGTVVPTFAQGQDPSGPVELASVGKSITALCLASLVQDGALGYDDRLPEVLAKPAPDVTIAQLLTHSSGLKEDPTQAAMPEWLDDRGDHAGDVLALVSGHDPQDAAYSYNNVNYALLSLAIEAAAGAPYAETCKARVTTPLGLEAAPSPRTGSFAAWGGWRMTAADYAALHAHHYSTATPAGRAPFDHPTAPVTDAVSYGLGTFIRRSATAHNFWHFGALCFPERLNAGSYAVTWSDDWTVVATYTFCPTLNAMWALDVAMGTAAYGALNGALE